MSLVSQSILSDETDVCLPQRKWLGTASIRGLLSIRSSFHIFVKPFANHLIFSEIH